MRNIIIPLFILLLANTFCYSQLEIVTKVTYEQSTPHGTQETVLFFTNNQSIFKHNILKDNKSIEQTIEGDQIKVKIDNTDSIGSYQFIKDNKIYERRNIGKKYYLIEEDLTPLNWNMVDSSKKIGNYTCQLATSTCYGRKFYAWYTSEIASDCAPWKLKGLPGLVLYAYDAEFQYIWKAVKVEKHNFDFSYFPTDEERITLSDYFILLEEDFQRKFTFAQSLVDETKGEGVVIERSTSNYIEKETKR